MNEREIMEKVTASLQTVLELDDWSLPEEVNRDTRLSEDLGLDSYDRAILSSPLSKHFQLNFIEEETQSEGCLTVGDLCDLVAKKL